MLSPDLMAASVLRPYRAAIGHEHAEAGLHRVVAFDSGCHGRRDLLEAREFVGVETDDPVADPVGRDAEPHPRHDAADGVAKRRGVIGATDAKHPFLAQGSTRRLYLDVTRPQLVLSACLESNLTLVESARDAIDRGEFFVFGVLGGRKVVETRSPD